MYAELSVTLKSGVKPEIISNPLTTYFGNSRIDVGDALRNTPIAGYVKQAVGAAAFPSGAIVVYLCIASDQISVYVYGKTIPQLKEQCTKAIKQLRKINGVKIYDASASILVPINGMDVDILTGKEASWFPLFGDALLDRSISKLITAGVNSLLAIYFLGSAATPTVSALIGLAATMVGVFFEAIHSAYGADSWLWKESK